MNEDISIKIDIRHVRDAGSMAAAIEAYAENDSEVASGVIGTETN